MSVWHFLLEKFLSGHRVVLLYVLESNGSSPGRQGFKMGVSSDNEICGTIGGGIMEHKFVELARSQLSQRATASTLHKQIHDKSASENQSGMICSGDQTIFLHHVQEQDIPHLEFICDAVTKKDDAAIVLNESGIAFSTDSPTLPFVFKLDAPRFELIEGTAPHNFLHVIGGGHCSLALCKLMREMDFHISLYETRSELNTVHQNSFADEIHILESYSDITGLINSGDNVYLVIMTFGYRTDDEALRALAGKSFRYLGMLGSKNKVAKMRSEYESERFDSKLLEQLHSPIGIQIKSETATEIAVSIAAEIISIKNKS